MAPSVELAIDPAGPLEADHLCLAVKALRAGTHLERSSDKRNTSRVDIKYRYR